MIRFIRVKAVEDYHSDLITFVGLSVSLSLSVLMRGGGTDGIAGITGNTVVRLLLPLEVRVDHVRTQSARTDRKVSAIPTEEELVTPTELQIVLSGSRDFFDVVLPVVRTVRVAIKPVREWIWIITSFKPFKSEGPKTFETRLYNSSAFFNSSNGTV